MLDARKDKQDKLPDTAPAEVVSYYEAPTAQKEVVCSYQQPCPLPDKARPLCDPELPKKKKKSRKGLWIFLACLGLTLGVVVANLLLDGKNHHEDDGDSASSIVDIGEVSTSIPRVEGEEGVVLDIQPSAPLAMTPQEVYEKVNPSTVTVVAEAESGKGASVGTGVIMTADGYIITNAHVISSGKSCWIALSSGATLDARLVGYDEPQDLAVLKVEPKMDLTPAEFGDSLSARVGDTVYAIGNPLGLELRGTMTDGMLSAVGRTMDMHGGTSAMLQTTAALNSGNSGGPLINEAGQVIGINTMKMSNTDLEKEATVEGLGFALPISDMKPVVDDLIALGEFRGMPMLGVTVLTVTVEDVGNRVMIHTISPGGGADEAGLQASDMILMCDGESVDHIDDLLAIRRDHRVGDIVTLTVEREGETFEVEVTLHSDREVSKK